MFPENAGRTGEYGELCRQLRTRGLTRHAPRASISARARFASVHLQKLQGAIERADVRASARRRLLLPLQQLRGKEPDRAHRPDAESAGTAPGYRGDSVIR